MKHALFSLALVMLFTLLANPLFAVVEVNRFESTEMEKRYQGLIEELRCLVCQNQNLADSDATLAKDLRARVIELLREGKSDREIRNFLRKRYGDFVLYNPPFTAYTALLWIGPFLIFLAALLGVRKHVKQQAITHSADTDTEKLNEIRALLLETDQEPGGGKEK